MHLEILVEDLSGKIALEHLIPRLVGPEHTYRIFSYKGIGRLPKGMKGAADPGKRILLGRLPQLLRGYGKTFVSYGANKAAVVLVCDLDRKDLKEFLGELNAVNESFNPRPEVRFCIAIEEGEAWLLGDLSAVKSAYPKAKDEVLRGYVNDSICGTWELLANAVYQGGAQALIREGHHAVGAQKCAWAEKITPLVRSEENLSPSFRFFRDSIRDLVAS